MFLHLLLLHLDDEMHLGWSVVLRVILDKRRHLLSLQDVFQLLLKVLRPEADRKLSDLDFIVPIIGDGSTELEAVFTKWFNFASPTAEPGRHWKHGVL